ncbi:ParB/RepB/Spo0J family partition protein [Streptomyces roseoverticillatus]|uniref:ParB/RepB/Spo0J family partition protein n=1 Tax=Streptomyces roseoverticillatus TaxID=66429 RepID=UPI001F411921|nr:ParB/RepB/Spo0J family partition protein [Streptomyces roseoverticillatus]MCF3105378.1 ParB/RepB/Spo0J family partition protein [Streptomyces roseoverticillatus]
MKASERLGNASSFSGLSSRRQLINQATGHGASARPSSSVPISQLAHNPFNPREELTDLDETIASLQEKGQLTALTVVSRDAFLNAYPEAEEEIASAEWVVLDGNRRLASARRAGLTELRVDVNDALAASAADLLENALIANLHRADIPPLDEAKVVRDLVKIHGSQGIVAQHLSKSGAWVSQRLALLELPDDLQEKVEAGELKVKDGRRIGRLPRGKQHAEAEKAINRVKAPRKPRAPQVAADAPATPPSTTPAPSSGLASPPEAVNPVKTPPAALVPEQAGTPERNPVEEAVGQLLVLAPSAEALADALAAYAPASTVTALSELLIERMH